MNRWLQRLVPVEPQEQRALWLAFVYFFCLLAGYYVLRPLRDEMGIAGGVRHLPWVFTGTFFAMLVLVPLFGALTARYPRRRFLPAVYGFFIANILLFFALFESALSPAWVARFFFIWVSVFNLFVVSVFWSFMVDLFTSEQARRLFGFIAAGGTAGAIAGPALTAALAPALGPVNLLLVSAALLSGALFCVHALVRWAKRSALPATTEPVDSPLGGGIWEGVSLVLRTPYLLGIALFMLLFTSLSTFLYFEQAHIVAAAFDDPGRRTALFAAMDLGVNVLTLLTQALVTGRLMSRLRLPAVLVLVPFFVLVGFVALALVPVLTVLVVFQVLRRAGDYAITRPAREVLYTVVPRAAKYKAKNFLDTVVYRGGDAASGWLFAALQALGLGLVDIAWATLPMALGWVAIAWWLGRRQESLAQGSRTQAPLPAR